MQGGRQSRPASPHRRLEARARGRTPEARHDHAVEETLLLLPFGGFSVTKRNPPSMALLHPDAHDWQIPGRAFQHSFDTIERAVFVRGVVNRIDRVSQSPDRSAQIGPVLQLKSRTPQIATLVIPRSLHQEVARELRFVDGRVRRNPHRLPEPRNEPAASVMGSAGTCLVLQFLGGDLYDGDASMCELVDELRA